MKSPLPLAALALFLLAPSLHAVTVNLAASKDNTIFSESSDLSNALGPDIFVGRNLFGDDRRALIAFDISGIAAGSIINSVTLTLRGLAGPNPSPSIGVHRALADWGEGTSFNPTMSAPGGVAPTDGDVTWTQTFYNAANPGASPLWATPGGDFVATASATQLVPTTSASLWTGAGLVADVQAWVNGTASNFGWELVTSGNVRRIASSENPTASFRPSLVIDFSPVPEPSRAVLLLTAAFAITLRRGRT